MEFLVAQLLLKHVCSGNKGGSFRQPRSGVMLQPTDGAWEGGGGVLGSSPGTDFSDSDEINRTKAKLSADQMRCSLSSWQPR